MNNVHHIHYVDKSRCFHETFDLDCDRHKELLQEMAIVLGKTLMDYLDGKNDKKRTLNEKQSLILEALAKIAKNKNELAYIMYEFGRQSQEVIDKKTVERILTGAL